jgi:hypothetical protein
MTALGSRKPEREDADIGGSAIADLGDAISDPMSDPRAKRDREW